MTHVLMLAAENDALPGGKIGGIGDVVRDVPPALAAQDCTVSVVTPAYGVFSQHPGAQHISRVKVDFAATQHTVHLYKVPGRQKVNNVSHWVLDHPLFSACGKGRIYCDDPPQQPFATDASKFALFCLAATEAILQGSFGTLDVIHLHDWHAAFLLILRRYNPRYQALRQLRCVYTIHNLALQGIRPFAHSGSSLDTWYQGLQYDHELLADPRWPDCVNPMAVGIRLADAVHVVSPAYAEEILRPSAVAIHGQYGGEGLEADLRTAQAEQRLFGILNGCEYPEDATTDCKNEWASLLTLMRAQALQWAGSSATLASAHYIAHTRLNAMNTERPSILLTSIGRITDQKVRLFRETTSREHTALEELLQTLGERGLLLLLGSGDPDYEQFFSMTAARFDNFVFLNGYSDALSQALYAQGDLFLMPSSFEPCGISQMLALRAGQPCLVHHVGGLRDTVTDNKTGFTFTGNSPTQQADQLVATVQRALTVHAKDPEQWQALCQAAAAERFRWSDSIAAYLERLYRVTTSG